MTAQKWSGFAGKLNRWYRKNARKLPWRETRDPYKIWISEVMLQQTTVNAVIPYYQRWIRTFPTIDRVAKAPIQKVLKSWQGLGYYQRAKNIHTAAKMMVKHHQARLPRDAQVLKSLPGFGPYTTGAFLSIAFDQRQPIIDANVRRVVMRLTASPGPADSRHDGRIYEFLDRVMPRKGNRIFNQALMELGALVCRAREPICLLCPVKEHCQAYKKGIQEVIPEPKRTVIKDIEAVVAVLQRRGKYFIQKRSSTGLLADLWEFPGGKIERGETPDQALARELKEELGVHLKTARHLMHVRHCYTQFRVKLHVAACTLTSYPAADRTHKWINPAQLTRFPMPSGSARIVERLLHKS